MHGVGRSLLSTTPRTVATAAKAPREVGPKVHGSERRRDTSRKTGEAADIGLNPTKVLAESRRAESGPRLESRGVVSGRAPQSARGRQSAPMATSRPWPSLTGAALRGWPR